MANNANQSNVTKTGITPQMIMHPGDQRGMDRLKSIPGLVAFINNTIVPLREKVSAVNLRGRALEINETDFSHVYDQMLKVGELLGVDIHPEMFMIWEYDIHTATEGVAHPQIIMASGAIDLLDDAEQQFAIGRQFGHILCGHQPYRLLLHTLYSSMIKAVPTASKWIGVVRPFILDWYRKSDYTADRAGLLACGSYEAAMHALIKMAGIPRKYYDQINIEAFLTQAEDFDRSGHDFTTNLIQTLSINGASVPWIVARAAELHKWYNSEEYTIAKQHLCEL